jgi:hypothetical protein
MLLLMESLSAVIGADKKGVVGLKVRGQQQQQKVMRITWPMEDLGVGGIIASSGCSHVSLELSC